MTSTIDYSEIVFLDEIFHSEESISRWFDKFQNSFNKSYRVTGLVTSISFENRNCVLSHPQYDYSLLIDLSGVGLSAVKTDTMFQFIGTFKMSSEVNLFC
jgi:hypothetical protein